MRPDVLNKEARGKLLYAREVEERELEGSKPLRMYVVWGEKKGLIVLIWRQRSAHNRRKKI